MNQALIHCCEGERECTGGMNVTNLTSCLEDFTSISCGIAGSSSALPEIGVFWELNIQII
jgi:hypothetical protein